MAGRFALPSGHEACGFRSCSLGEVSNWKWFWCGSRCDCDMPRCFCDSVDTSQFGMWGILIRITGLQRFPFPIWTVRFHCEEPVCALVWWDLFCSCSCGLGIVLAGMICEKGW
jgi:hypothetical protein